MLDEKFKPTQETSFRVSYSDIDMLIPRHFGHDFCCLADLEMSNGTYARFDIKAEAPEQWNLESLEKFIATGKGNYMTRILLTELARRGTIPVGIYYIDVSW